MSVDVNTDLGILRLCRGDVVLGLVVLGLRDIWLLWCPVCEDWERLSVEQFEGRLSVNHAATGCPSGYHETHNFSLAVTDVSAVGQSRNQPSGLSTPPRQRKARR